MGLTYCGVNCDECLVYLASVSRNTDEQLAAKYKESMPEDFSLTPACKEEDNIPIFKLHFSEKIAYKVYIETDEFFQSTIDETWEKRESKDENECIRRLGREGYRPALPWGQALTSHCFVGEGG